MRRLWNWRNVIWWWYEWASGRLRAPLLIYQFLPFLFLCIFFQAFMPVLFSVDKERLLCILIIVLNAPIPHLYRRIRVFLFICRWSGFVVYCRFYSFLFCSWQELACYFWPYPAGKYIALTRYFGLFAISTPLLYRYLNVVSWWFVDFPIAVN